MSQNPFKSTFGLSISSSALVAVELSHEKKDQLTLVNYAYLPLAPGIVEDNCIIIDANAFKQAVTELLKSGKKGPFESKNVIISFPEEKTFSHHLTLKSDELENESIILQKARDFIPIDLREAITDFKRLKDAEPGKVKIDFVAVQQNIIQALIDVFHEIGLNIVFIDVNKNSLNRFCHNEFQKNEQDYFIMYAGEHHTLFMLNQPSGSHYMLSSDHAGQWLTEHLKKTMNISLAEAKAALYNAQGDLSARVIKALNPVFNEWISTLKKLLKVGQDQKDLNPKTLYLIGPYSRVSGLAAALHQIFPDLQIINRMNYLNIQGQQSLIYSMAAGLALRAVTSEKPEEEINLLPKNKKEVLINQQLQPAIKRFLAGTLIILISLIMVSGFAMAKAYIDFKISKKEMEISLERAESPYLKEVAKQRQQQAQLKTQVDMLLKTALPPRLMMEKINTYNAGQVKLVSAVYTVRPNQPGIIQLRARLDSRADTEAFVRALEQDSFFTEVISPLSNLTGKGERFVTIDLVLNEEEFLKAKAAENQKAPARPKVKLPDADQ